MMQSTTSSNAVTIETFRLEHLQETLGIGTPRPRLSWTVLTGQQNWLQSAYELELYKNNALLETQKINSSESVLVPWVFQDLQSRESVSVRVRVWGEDQQVSDWSEPLTLELGLTEPDDWTAHFVSPKIPEDISKPEPAKLLRREFAVRQGVKRARLYVTALGVFETEINGTRVGNHVLAPGWTSYFHRLRYQTFDVTHQLLEGQNAIGATLGDGWFRGRLGFGSGNRNKYGTRLALLAQLEIEYTDGSIERVVTDENWRAATGAILASDIYDGETYDARLEHAGWTKAGFDDAAWSHVEILERDLTTLISPSGPPVRRIQEIAPVNIFKSPSGKTLVDFGQNLVGFARFTVSGNAGQTITLRHAEVLEHGELGTRPLRHAAATDRYILRGDQTETWQPKFTFHGFQYLEIEGYPGELKPEHIKAIVCHSDLERRGWFECSNPLVNRLHENVVWSMRGNFLDLPTDCPQRDERLGWTGDIQVFTPTASFLYDSAGFLESWLADLKAEQTETGAVPFTIPNILENGTTPMTAWGDAATIVPWVLYQRYGDVGILERQFDSMKAWVDCIDTLAGDTHVWDQSFQFGDWLDPSAPPEDPAAAKTQPVVVATAYFARSSEIVGLAATVLGRNEDAKKYTDLAATIREAFASQFVTPNGLVISDATTAYSLALEFHLLPTQAQRVTAGERLTKLAREAGYRISTGFVGTPLICDALCSVGAYDTAYKLLMQRDCPSWLYPVTMGATTIWERWDSMLPDGSINPGEMTSFNHYALGAVADWLHRTVAGLAPAAPGYKKISIRPQIGGGLTSASAKHITPYGMAQSSWKLEVGNLQLEVVIPANTTATVVLPGDGKTLEIGSGMYSWEYPFTPSSAQQKLTLESTLGDLYGDLETHSQVLALVREFEPNSVTNDGGLRGNGGMTIRELTFMMQTGKSMLEKIQNILDKQNSL